MRLDQRWHREKSSLHYAKYISFLWSRMLGDQNYAILTRWPKASLYTYIHMTIYYFADIIYVWHSNNSLLTLPHDWEEDLVPRLQEHISFDKVNFQGHKEILYRHYKSKQPWNSTMNCRGIIKTPWIFYNESLGDLCWRLLKLYNESWEIILVPFKILWHVLRIFHLNDTNWKGSMNLLLKMWYLAKVYFAFEWVKFMPKSFLNTNREVLLVSLH